MKNILIKISTVFIILQRLSQPQFVAEARAYIYLGGFVLAPYINKLVVKQVQSAVSHKPKIYITEAEPVLETDIPKLVVDPTKEIPSDKIEPVPTPQPRIEDKLTSVDNRSWTKFKYASLIAKYSRKYKIDPQVIYATIMTESEGNEYAFRYEPAIEDASLGMGQILISTARRLGFHDEPKKMYDPEVNIELIAKYHRNSLDTFGRLNPIQLATAYNAGSPWNTPVPGHLYRFEMWLEEKS
jgi:hypothetical protein